MLNLWRSLADQAPTRYVVLVEQGIRVDAGIHRATLTTPVPWPLAVELSRLYP